ncbi:MAG: hypothetical protein ACTSWY_09445 [Promethearchaeota archaeon]
MQDRSNTQTNDSIHEKALISTRLRDAEPGTFDPNIPRLGRRDSEPHSSEVSYLHDVLTTNFPDDRTVWDLHHFFHKEGMDIDIQFDISYFKDLQIPYTLSSYDASKFENRVPTLAINILSKSTWRSDLAEKVDFCRILKIPLYIVFPAYNVFINIYKPPFLRVYTLQQDGTYKVQELRKSSFKSSGELNLDAVINVVDIVPFRLGLKKQEKKHQENRSLFRLVLIDPNEKRVLLTKLEKIIAEQGEKINKLESENLKLKSQLNEKFE